ncbi:hypothetical protein B0H17DRAFT_961594, partial [Mycena rosella]
ELVRLPGHGKKDRDSGLSAGDFRALVRAREELTAVWMLTMSPYVPDLAPCAALAPLEPACTTVDALQSGKAHHKLVRESGVADGYLYDPLCGIQALIEADLAAEGYCVACVALRREIWANRREKVWDNLDIWFGLDG